MAIRLINDQIIIHHYLPQRGELISHPSFITHKPSGKFLIVGFMEHIISGMPIHLIVEEAIKQDIGIIYVCDKLPKNPIKSENVIYLETGFTWFTHLLFHNPIAFKGVFAKGKALNLAKRFSNFTKYSIPIIDKVSDIKDFSKTLIKSTNSILLDITGGVGDNLLCIPIIKTLISKGKKVYVCIPGKRKDVFKNLDYIEGIYLDKDKIDVEKFDKIIQLNFGSLLNDYRYDLNKQNRIYSIANVCGLSEHDLTYKAPEIILTKEELDSFKEYDNLPNKLFFGFDSDRTNTIIPKELVQTNIDKLYKKGFTVFISSLREYKFNNCINLCGKLSLRQLFCIINKMDFILTVDTSFAHIGAAFNKKMVLLCNYFLPEWRFSTYTNAVCFTPNIKCYPCQACQIHSFKDRVCSNEYSCYDFFDWDNIINTLNKFKLSILSSAKILIKSTTGELGDKLVVLSLLLKYLKKNKNYKISLLTESERFNKADGYYNLFKNYVSECFISSKDVNEQMYDDVIDLSAYSIHSDELLSTVSKSFQLSRFQRWGKKLGLNYIGDAEIIDFKSNKIETNKVNKLFKRNKQKLPVIGFGIFSSNLTKDWEFGSEPDIKKWQSLINIFNSKGCSCVSFHYKSLNFKNCINTGGLSIEELLYSLKYLDLFIGVESGLSHFCGLLGIPMAVLIGSSSPLVLRHYNNVCVIHKGDCNSCNRFIVPDFAGCQCGSLNSNAKSQCLYYLNYKEIYSDIKEFIGEYFKNNFGVKL